MSLHIYWTITHVGGWLLILLTAGGLGHLILRRVRFHSGVERIVFTLAVGLGGCALFLFLLTLVGLLASWFILALTICGAVATLVLTYRELAITTQRVVAQWRRLPAPRKWGSLIFIIGAAGYEALLLLSTQFPPLQWDALSNHLVLVREALLAHRFVLIEPIPHPVLPLLNHMLFAWGMAVKDDIIAQMIGQTFLTLAAVAAYAWGERHRNRLFGVAAASFWLAHPVVLLIAEGAYVDISVSCYAFLGIYALYIFWYEDDHKYWYLSAALLSMAAASKIPGLFFLGCGGLLGTLKLLRAPVTGWRVWLRGCALIALLTLPWYGLIGYYTGNPVWPLLPQFTRPEWGGIAAGAKLNLIAGVPQIGLGNGVLDFCRVFYRLVFYPQSFWAPDNLTFFPLIIAWPISLLIALWSRRTRWWALWALAFTVFWFLSIQDLRYWFPGVLLAGLALCESIRWITARITQQGAVTSKVFVTALWVALILWPLAYGADFTFRRIRALGTIPPVTQQQRDSFFEVYKAGYRAIQYINEHAAPQEATYISAYNYVNYFFKGGFLNYWQGAGKRGGPSNPPPAPVYRWPDDERWLKSLRERNVNWIYVGSDLNPDLATRIKSTPTGEYIWPEYKLVYSDRWAWVFRYTPDPKSDGSSNGK